MTSLLADIKATLEWYNDAGVDEAIEPLPVSRAATKKLVATDIDSPAKSLQAPQSEPLTKQAINPLHAAPAKALAEAKALAAQCNTIDELKEAVNAFEGLSIRKTAQNTVFADGNPEAEIMLIGEAPGADEDRSGIPFCGASGQLLDQMLGCIGLDRPTNFYITNTIFWRPPGNRKPTPEEIALCKPFVEKHIALLNPKLIILVGATALTALLETKTGISKIRGQFIDYENDQLKAPIKTRAFFHPSYLLRSPGQKKIAWQDLLEIDTFLTKENIKR